MGNTLRVDQRGATTLWDLVERRAAATPDAVLAVDGAGRTLTFAEYRDRALVAAAGFHARGVGEGTIVSWQLPNWLETFVLAAALARLGCVQNPIAPLFREREVGFITAQLGSDLLLVPSSWRGFEYGAMAASIAAGQPSLEVLLVDEELPAGDPSDLPPPPPLPATLADAPVRWVLYTSGTTADPKGARHVDHAFAHTALHMSARMHMDASDRNAIVFPFAHIGGILYVFADLIVGASSILLERFDADSIPILSREGVTIAGAGVPFFREYLRAQERSPGEPVFPLIKGFVGGGSTRPPELHHELVAAFGVGLQGGYGLTEACSFTMTDRDDSDDVRARTEGRPYPGSEIRVTGPDGEVLPGGQEGEIRLKGPQMMRGYVDPALDDVFDDEGYFRTGDLGRLDLDGNLHITGRLKDVIIRKGENISAREVEDLLYLHPAIDEAAVIGLPDPDTGERACAVVTLVEGVDGVDLGELRVFLTGKGLAIQKVPEQLEVVPELTKNVGGKVHKPSLRERFERQPFVRPQRTPSSRRQEGA